MRMQHVMITTVIHPVAVQQTGLSPSIHVSCSIPEWTAISLAAACRAVSLLPGLVMHVRCIQCTMSTSELNSVPPKVQQIAPYHQTLSIQVFRHQVNGFDCATDLLGPEFLSFFVVLQPEVLCFHVFDGAVRTAESQSSRCCSNSSRFVSELRVPVLLTVLDSRMASVAHCTIL